MLIELSLLVLLSVFVLTILLALIYFGLFDEIEVKVGGPPFEFGGRRIAYKRAKGKYNEAGSLFTEVCSLVPKLDSVGLYFDDPETVKDVNKCRFIVGAILGNEEPQCQQDQKLLVSKGFHLALLPDVDHVVYSTFPFKGIVSVVIAVRRVYPRLKEYIKV